VRKGRKTGGVQGKKKKFKRESNMGKKEGRKGVVKQDPSPEDKSTRGQMYGGGGEGKKNRRVTIILDKQLLQVGGPTRDVQNKRCGKKRGARHQRKRGREAEKVGGDKV